MKTGMESSNSNFVVEVMDTKIIQYIIAIVKF